MNENFPLSTKRRIITVEEVGKEILHGTLTRSTLLGNTYLRFWKLTFLNHPHHSVGKSLRTSKNPSFKVLDLENFNNLQKPTQINVYVA